MRASQILNLEVFMQKKSFGWTLRIAAVLVLAAGTGAQAQYWGSDRLPTSFSGQINAYSPTTTKAPTGPYEIRGPWSMELKRDGTLADFSTALNMELSDGWVLTNGVTPPNLDPNTRNAHTHIITMSNAAVTMLPGGGFQVVGPAFVTLNGGVTPFAQVSTLTIVVTGGTDVKFSNISLTFAATAPAAGHFGTAPLPGVIRKFSYDRR
jgi:hypothetical protein